MGVSRKYKIISGKYETGTAEQKVTFDNMLGVKDVQYKFDLYFHWYNIIHECGHCLLDLWQVEMDNVDEELWVNKFAIAFWKRADSSGRLLRLKEVLEQTIELIANPIPEGCTYIDFFKSIWKSIWEKDEAEAAMMYGYFQFSCVLEAMKGENDVTSLLQEVGVNVIPCANFEKYQGKIEAEYANEVLACCLQNLEKMGINLDCTLELIDDSTVHCAKIVGETPESL